jgi:hypothetical protein
VPHRDDDAEHGGDDPEPGQRVGGALQQGDRETRLLVIRLELGVEQDVELLGGDTAVHDVLQRVAKELDRGTALQERRVLREDRALLEVGHVLVEGDGTVHAKEREHLVLQLQQLEIVRLRRHRSA